MNGNISPEDTPIVYVGIGDTCDDDVTLPDVCSVDNSSQSGSGGVLSPADSRSTPIKGHYVNIYTSIQLHTLRL